MVFPKPGAARPSPTPGLLLAATSSLVVATGIANIWGRDAVSRGNGAKTLNAAYDERFVLGLGVSHEPLVEATARSRVRDAPRADARVPRRDGRGADVRATRATRVARVIAALGPKMLELAATLADGALPYLVTPEHTALARAAVGDKFIGVEQAVVLGQSREEYPRRAHEHLEIYTGLDNYRNSWRRLGFTDDDFVRGGSPSDSVTPWSCTATRTPFSRASTNTATRARTTSVSRCSARTWRRLHSTSGGGSRHSHAT